MKVLETSGNEGIWIRELSRQTKIPFTTVYLYLHKYLGYKVVIKDMEFGLNKTDRFKIVRLKKLTE